VRNTATKGHVMPVVRLPGGSRGTRIRPSQLARIMTALMVRIHRRAGDRLRGMDHLFLTTLGSCSGTRRTTPVARFDDGQGAGSSWPQPVALRSTRAGTTTLPPTPMRSESKYPELSTLFRSTSSWGNHVSSLGLGWSQGAPGFKGYLAKTDRQLPVVRLTPVSHPTTGEPTRDRRPRFSQRAGSGACGQAVAVAQMAAHARAVPAYVLTGMALAHSGDPDIMDGAAWQRRHLPDGFTEFVYLHAHISSR
jgi:hypothetical protein